MLVPEVLTAPRTATGSVDTAAWRQTRYQSIGEALLRRGYTLPQASQTALVFTVMSARETGAGGSERDFNVGNLRPGANQVPLGTLGWHGDYIQRSAGRYRAYASLDDGAEDMVKLLLNSRYGPAAAYLRETGDVQGWYERIIRPVGGGDGYYPATDAELAIARREIQSVYNRYAALGLTLREPSSITPVKIGAVLALGGIAYWALKGRA